MSVVAVSHVALVRARRELEKAYQANDWERVKKCDKQLGHQLNLAFADEHRDARSLVTELEGVLALYARMVTALPAEALGASSHKPQATS